MRVRVLFFGRLKEIVGSAEEDADVSEGARVEDLFLRYGRRYPEFASFRTSAIAAVNQQFADWRTQLSPGDEVAFLPPVSGGDIAGISGAHCDLVRAPISTANIVALLKSPEDGATAVFEGIVRNHSGGRATIYLEYFAYEPMALAKMREIAADMVRKFPVHRVAVVHRLGRIEIGETSVLIAVCSPHRAAAFDACRFGIDTLKRIVPIWKKEYFQDGAVWAEGVTPSKADQSFSG